MIDKIPASVRFLAVCIVVAAVLIWLGLWLNPTARYAGLP